MEPEQTETDDTIESEEETFEDLAIDNEARIDALTELLIRKGVISQQEFDDAYEAQFDEDPEEEI